MIELIPSTPRDITIVAANMREWDRTELEASATGSMTERALFCHYTSQPWACVALLNGEPVAAFGAAGTPLQPQVKVAWAFGTSRFRRVVPAISREIERWKPHFIADGIHRVEARCLVSHDLAGRWMAGLGFSREGVMRHYGRNGEDFELWAWTAEN